MSKPISVIGHLAKQICQCSITIGEPERLRCFSIKEIQEVRDCLDDRFRELKIDRLKAFRAVGIKQMDITRTMTGARSLASTARLMKVAVFYGVAYTFPSEMVE